MTVEGYTIQEITDLEAIREIARLRARVWIEEGVHGPERFPDGMWLDRQDLAARHFAAVHEGVIVAAARISVHPTADGVPYARAYRRYNPRLPEPVASFNRLVVDRPHRRRGLARALDLARLEAGTADGARSVVIVVPPSRMTALIALGFVYLGPATDDPELREVGINLQALCRLL